MSDVRATDVRADVYYDSVTLMRASRAVTQVNGVLSAMVAMATPLNLELIADMGFEVPVVSPNDMVVAVHARDEAAVRAAHQALEASLAEMSAPRAADSTGQAVPRSLTAAARLAPGANLALISVPGPSAFTEAMDALHAGLHVMVFSDNVGPAEEVALKDAAAERGLLVMGPDCGTAVIAGVGLGFANSVRPGPVGVVAASGTGSQQVMCLLDAAGVGVSHVLGVGGRDLSTAIGGRSTLRALQALGEDASTDVVMIVSKPPGPEVAERIRAAAADLGKPVVLALLGQGHDDLTSATEKALAAVGIEPPRWPVLVPHQVPAARRGALRGLFSGGTLCDEAMLIAAQRLGPVRSNIPLQPDWGLPPSLEGTGHVMIDFGDDLLTRGRPHPMIDSTRRLDRLAEEAADPETAVILIDVVLGHGSHPDPAPEFAQVMSRVQRDDLAVVVSLCGTETDPQDWHRQAEVLRAAGAWVHLSNASAARHAVALAEGNAK